MLTKDICKEYNHHTSKLYNLCEVHTFSGNIYEKKNNIKKTTI